MRHVPAFAPRAAALTGALTCALTCTLAAALVLFSGAPSAAAEPQKGDAQCNCSGAERHAARPRFADLDENEEASALESIQVGLTRMDDGTPFVWRHANGRLSGIVRPTASFRNAGGTLCRHVVVLLTTGYKTRTAEGIACRLVDGRWSLEG